MVRVLFGVEGIGGESSNLDGGYVALFGGLLYCGPSFIQCPHLDTQCIASFVVLLSWLLDQSIFCLLLDCHHCLVLGSVGLALL